MADELPVRFCPICKLADDHPRHAIYGDDPNVAKHMHCCRDQPSGCPDGSCDVLLAETTATGDALRAYLTDPANQERFAQALAARSEQARTFTSTAAPTVLNLAGS